MAVSGLIQSRTLRRGEIEIGSISALALFVLMHSPIRYDRARLGQIDHLQQRHQLRAGLNCFADARLPDAIWPIEKVVAVAERFFCILIDDDGDRLYVLGAMTFTRGAMSQLCQRIDPRRAVVLVSVITSSFR